VRTQTAATDNHHGGAIGIPSWGTKSACAAAASWSPRAPASYVLRLAARITQAAGDCVPGAVTAGGYDFLLALVTLAFVVIHEVQYYGVIGVGDRPRLPPQAAARRPP
jgi:hypothetical protein